jgi:hypothetical protein
MTEVQTLSITIDGRKPPGWLGYPPGSGRSQDVVNPPGNTRWPGSFRAILIAAAAFGAEQSAQRVEGGAIIGIRVKPAMALGADAALLADKQGAAKQIRPDRQAVEAPLVAFRADADQRGSLSEQRELDRLRAGRPAITRLGHAGAMT